MARIAFISTLDSVPWGGSEELWSQAARILMERGHTVGASIQWWPQAPAPVQQLESAGVLLQKRRERERYRMLFGNRYEQDFTKWLETFHADLAVLSLPSQSGGEDWMQLCAARSIPYAILVQAVVPHLWPGDADNEMLAQGYRNACKVYCVSSRNQKWLQTQFAQGLPQAEVVRNPYNVSRDAAPLWPSDPSTLRLACVGRFDPVAKGHDILLEVLRQEKWRAQKVHVSLIGSGGYERTLRALVEYFGLQSTVSFHAFTPDIEKVWAEHHALVLPSRFEGLPLVVVEAMLCGRACIVTDVAGNAELMEDNSSGFIAAAPTAVLLDEAMERAWQSWEDGTLESTGQRAATQVRRQVPPDPAAVFADKLESLI